MPMQLVAMHLELELAGAIALARVADRRPGAFVPDDDLAGAVLLIRDLPFEAVVRDGMVFNLHCHALVRRVEARTLGHSPAFHGAVELEAQVIVQARRPMLLDDELQTALRLCTTLAAVLRLRRDREVPLGFVRPECIVFRHGNAA